MYNACEFSILSPISIENVFQQKKGNAGPPLFQSNYTYYMIKISESEKTPRFNHSLLLGHETY